MLFGVWAVKYWFSFFLRFQVSATSASGLFVHNWLLLLMQGLIKTLDFFHVGCVFSTLIESYITSFALYCSVLFLFRFCFVLFCLARTISFLSRYFVILSSNPTSMSYCELNRVLSRVFSWDNAWWDLEPWDEIILFEAVSSFQLTFVLVYAFFILKNIERQLPIVCMLCTCCATVRSVNSVVW